MDPADDAAAPRPAAPEPSPPPPDLPGAWRDVLAPWGLGLVVLWGTGLLAALGGLAAEVAGTVTAAFFLLVPLVVARRRGLDPAAMGLHAGGALRSVMAALLVAAVVFPAYAGLFAGWAAWVEGRPLRFSADLLSDVPASLRGRPALDKPPDALLAWSESDALWVLNATGAPLDLSVRGCAGAPSGLARRGGRLFSGEAGVQPATDGTLSGTLAPGAGWRCALSGADLEVAPSGGAAVPLRTGEGLRDAAGPLRASRSPLWLLELLALHLLVVALPEEAFYRGLVQTRLAGRFRRRFRVLGADLGGEVVVASALFALSHLVAIPAPFRLAVFFPGLLFGWLRVRTGSVAGPALLHALSNVLLAVLVRMQG